MAGNETGSGSFNHIPSIQRKLTTCDNVSNKLAINLLRPTLKNLPCIAAQRIMIVLDSAVTRILLVASFPRIIENLDEFSLLIGREATTLFKEYGPLSALYEMYKERSSDNEFPCITKEKILQNAKSLLPSSDGETRNLSVISGNSLPDNADQLHSCANDTDSDGEAKGVGVVLPETGEEYSRQQTTDSIVNSDSNMSPTDTLYERKRSAHMNSLILHSNADFAKCGYDIKTSKFPLALSITDNIFPGKEVYLEQIADQLFTLTRKLIRELMLNPVAVNSIIRHHRQWGIQPSAGARQLANLVIQLRILTNAQLLTTPKARIKRDNMLEKIARRDSEQKRTIVEMLANLSALSKRQFDLMDAKTKDICEIQENMLNLQKRTQHNLLEEQKQYYVNREQEKQRHLTAMQYLENELAEIRNQLQQTCDVNREDTQRLRKEKWRIEEEVDSVLKKLDTELLDMDTEYQERLEEKRIEQEAYDYLEQRFKPLHEEYNRIMEERRQEEEKERLEKEERINMIIAATKIQSLWRSWNTRKMIRASKKKVKKAKK